MELDLKGKFLPICRNKYGSPKAFLEDTFEEAMERDLEVIISYHEEGSETKHTQAIPAKCNRIARIGTELPDEDPDLSINKSSSVIY